MHEYREGRRWMIQRLGMSRSQPETTHHRPSFGSGKGRERESNNSPPRTIRNAAVTTPRSDANKDKESHTRRSEDLEKPSCSPPSIKTPHNPSTPITPIKLSSFSSCCSYASRSSCCDSLSVLAAVADGFPLFLEPLLRAGPPWREFQTSDGLV